MENTKNNEINKSGNYYVSLPPHIKDNTTVRKIMLDVIIALLPALIGSIYFFGLNALYLIVVCIVCCVGTEYIFQKLMHKKIQINDLSAVITGILLAFNLPANMPLWMAALGSIFGILIVKECFGGIGKNFINPALAARLFLMTSWTKNMTNYTNARGSFAEHASNAISQATSSATPLQLIHSNKIQELPPLQDMFFGNIGGVLGETSVLLLLIGAIYLLFKGIIGWRIPVVYLLSTAIILILLKVPLNIIPYELFGGGLILGAFFMATDYATSPINNKGKIIFAIGCGIITAVIRAKGSLPEGVSYSICFMNAATPLIDRLTRTKAYGGEKK